MDLVAQTSVSVQNVSATTGPEGNVGGDLRTSTLHLAPEPPALASNQGLASLGPLNGAPAPANQHGDGGKLGLNGRNAAAPGDPVDDQPSPPGPPSPPPPSIPAMSSASSPSPSPPPTQSALRDGVTSSWLDQQTSWDGPLFLPSPRRCSTCEQLVDACQCRESKPGDLAVQQDGAGQASSANGDEDAGKTQQGSE